MLVCVFVGLCVVGVVVDEFIEVVGWVRNVVVVIEWVVGFVVVIFVL